MNHSQQLELSLGKRTELICTPNKLRVNVGHLKVRLFTYSYVTVSGKWEKEKKEWRCTHNSLSDQM